MLVLTRKSGEGITIGDDILITLLEIKGSQVRLGIKAPPGVRIYRKEVYEKIKSDNILSSKLSMNEFSRIKDSIK